jgi:hypothetical protein
MLADFLRGIGVKLGASVSFLDDQDCCVISGVPARTTGRIGGDADENGIISTLWRAGRNYRCRFFKANHAEIFKALFRELAQLSKASHAVLLQTPEQSVIRRTRGVGGRTYQKGGSITNKQNSRSKSPSPSLGTRAAKKPTPSMHNCSALWLMNARYREQIPVGEKGSFHTHTAGAQKRQT